MGSIINPNLCALKPPGALFSWLKWSNEKLPKKKNASLTRFFQEKCSNGNQETPWMKSSSGLTAEMLRHQQNTPLTLSSLKQTRCGNNIHPSSKKHFEGLDKM